MSTGNASAQNNVITSAEYQQAADEITEIINVQRAERAPIEAQQELLQNRQEILIARRQSALNTLQAAEAAPSETAFLEASRTAYARATGEVEATNFAIQQNRSVLAQSRQSTAELQEQRGRLEVNADLAAKGAPTLNSLPPPATTVPAEPPSYVAPPEPPVLTQSSSIPQPAAPVPPLVPAGENNVSVAQQWGETELEISSTARGIRAENAAIAANIDSLQSQGAAAARIDRALENQVIDARLAGASNLEISQLETLQIQAVARTAEINNQITRQESALAQNQETLGQLEQQRFIAEEAQFAASSGTPGLNSVPPPATAEPDQDPYTFETPNTEYANTFDAGGVAADGDEALQAYDEALLAQTEGSAFAQPEIPADGDEALVAYEQALLAQTEGSAFAQPEIPADGDEALVAYEQALLAQQEGRAFAQPEIPADGDEALQAYEQALLAQQEGRAFSLVPQALNDPYYGLTPQQIQALGGADPTDPYIRARLGIPQLPGSELVATPGFGTIKTGVPLIDNALSFLGGLFGRPAAPPTPAAAEVTAASDAELQAIQDAEAQQLAEQEGRAFPPVDDAAPVGDEALQAIEDAQAAELAAQEGTAFAEPVSTLDDPEARAIQDAIDADLAAQEGTAFAEPVTLDDPEARAIQDAIDADLAAQEGLAFPPVENPAPVDPNDAVTQFEDVEAAELAAQEGSAFVVDEPLPVDVGSDEELRAIEDAQAAELAAQEGTAFAEPVTLDDPEARAIQDAIDADLAAQEGTAFAEPVTLDDPEARAIQDAIDADLAAQEGSAFPPVESPAPPSGDEALQAIEDAEAAQLADQEGSAFATDGPAPVTDDPAYGGASADEQAAINQAIADSAAGSSTAARTNNAQRQSTLQSRKNQPSAADWRVRLQLAPGANYLYAANDKSSRGILAPLYDTDGVIFPYTPSIETNYKAKYDAYDLVHSNYRGYFYKNSSVDEVGIKATFTAQDTREAQYLLAVIHFFRSVTKMFYGQDSQAGTPPPLVYLSGLGQYQFNNHPCLVSSFTYSLPTDVDYIRADGFNNIGVNLENRRSLGSGPAPGGAVGTIQRLLTNGLTKGAQPKPPVPGPVTQNVTNQNSINSTYVPTKMDINITLYPVQTRNQVSQQFSLAGFAQGRLLQGGFW
jgi:hypothetical protein